MGSDWLGNKRNQCQLIRLDQIRVVDKATYWQKFWDKKQRKNGQGFQQTTIWFCKWNNNRTVKNHPKDQNTVKTTSFSFNVWKTWHEEKNIVNRIEKNEQEKQNKLLETFYTEVKNKKWRRLRTTQLKSDNGCTVATSLEESENKFTNYSARKTTVSKPKKANVERSDIVKVTGHRSVQYLEDYEEADKEEQRRLSLAISKRNYENPCADKKQIAVSNITTILASLVPVTRNMR